jgi:hypothetical protein
MLKSSDVQKILENTQVFLCKPKVVSEMGASEGNE